MKSLDETMSQYGSPFAEVEANQTELNNKNYIQYQHDALINAIGKNTGYHEFDLYLDDIYSLYSDGEFKEFLLQCLDKLNSIYPIDVVYAYIMENELVQDDPASIKSFIEFFVYNKWMDCGLYDYLSRININKLSNNKNLFRAIKEVYLNTKEQIKSNRDIHQLIRYQFDYCPRDDGERMLRIWLCKDINGVISKSLIGRQNGK